MKQHAQFQNLHSAIHSRQDALTPTERRIASYLLEQTQEIALISVHELAARLHTGPASILRVVRKLGYAGLAALKAELRQEIRSTRSPLAQFKASLNHGLEPALDEIHRISEQEVKNINETFALLDRKSFEKAIQILTDADHIYTLGVGVSAHLAGMVSFVFRRIGMKADAIPHNGLALSENLVALGKGDVLIAFSLPPYSEQTITAAAQARKQGVTILGFSDRLLAPIAEHSTVMLTAKTESRLPTNSLSAPLLLIYGLISAVAAKARPRSLKALERTIKLRR